MRCYAGRIGNNVDLLSAAREEQTISVSQTAGDDKAIRGRARGARRQSVNRERCTKMLAEGGESVREKGGKAEQRKRALSEAVRALLSLICSALRKQRAEEARFLLLSALFSCRTSLGSRRLQPGGCWRKMWSRESGVGRV